MTRRGRASFALALLALAPLATTTPSEAAENDRARAKEAYDRGLEAHRRGEPRKAAEEFARADALSPSTVSLQAALDAAIEADDAPLGVELLERSKREPPEPGLASSITSAHIRFTGRAGRVRVLCPSGAVCAAKIDDRPVDVDRVVWAQVGPRPVTLRVDGATHAKVVDVSADQLVEVSLASKAAGAPPAVATRPPPADAEVAASSSPPHDHGRGLPKGVVYIGAGLTVVLAGSALYFAIDAGHQHRSFKNAGCATANFTDCSDLRARGQDSQTAANVSLVLMALSAAATAVIGVAFTNWNGPVLTASPTGAGAAWRATF